MTPKVIVNTTLYDHCQYHPAFIFVSIITTSDHYHYSNDQHRHEIIMKFIILIISCLHHCLFLSLIVTFIHDCLYGIIIFIIIEMYLILFSLGSLPTFIDAGTNFNSYHITEDNILDQALKQNKNISFMGCSTWTELFPNHFHRKLPFSGKSSC